MLGILLPFANNNLVNMEIAGIGFDISLFMAILQLAGIYCDFTDWYMDRHGRTRYDGH